MTSIFSVLFSLNSRMLTFAQATMSLMHDCIELSSFDMISGKAGICNCMSLANKWCVIECDSLIVDKVSMHIVQNVSQKLNAVDHQRLQIHEQSNNQLKWQSASHLGDVINLVAPDKNYLIMVSVNPELIGEKHARIDRLIASNRKGR